jgi:hypothetical protein
VNSSRSKRYEELGDYTDKWAEIKEKERITDEIMAMITRKERKGKGKFEGKLPLNFFSCNRIGHFASRRPTRIPKYKHRYKKRDTKVYNVSDGVSDESNEEDEIGFVAIKEEEPIIE